MAARRASLGHRDLAMHPSPGLLDCLTRSWVLRLLQFEKGKNVLRAPGRPQSQKPMVGVGERSATAECDEAGVAFFWEDQG
jgi:hypothetical protein